MSNYQLHWGGVEKKKVGKPNPFILVPFWFIKFFWGDGEGEGVGYENVRENTNILRFFFFFGGGGVGDGGGGNHP